MRCRGLRTALTADVVRAIRAGSIEVHAWDVNTIADLELAAAQDLPVSCTDHPEQAPHWRAVSARLEQRPGEVSGDPSGDLRGRQAGRIDPQLRLERWRRAQVEQVDQDMGRKISVWSACACCQTMTRAGDD